MNPPTAAVIRRRRLGIVKKDNEYANQVRALEGSKAVWMAIAFSFAMRLSDENPEQARTICLEEWTALHRNGIVTQRPKRLAEREIA